MSRCLLKRFLHKERIDGGLFAHAVIAGAGPFADHGSYRWPTPWLNLESASLVRIGTVEGKRRKGCLTAGKKHGQVYDRATFERALTTDANKTRKVSGGVPVAWPTSHSAPRTLRIEYEMNRFHRAHDWPTPVEWDRDSALALTVPLVESPCAAIPEISTVR